MIIHELFHLMQFPNDVVLYAGIGLEIETQMGTFRCKILFLLCSLELCEMALDQLEQDLHLAELFQVQ
jgi:hypothetical protein